VLAALFAFVLVSLALQANWPKLLRVGAAAGAYLGLVALLARRWWRPALAAACPYRVFAVAGAVAGALGGLLRPAPVLLVGAIGSVAGALLFGGFHYLALRAARERPSTPRVPARRTRPQASVGATPLQALDAGASVRQAPSRRRLDRGTRARDERHHAVVGRPRVRPDRAPHVAAPRVVPADVRLLGQGGRVHPAGPRAPVAA
jgi:hypothetical protein